MMIQHIPTLIYGNQSNRVFIYVHGKGGSKDGTLAKIIAKVVTSLDYQLITFDLPEHGDRKDYRRCDVFDGVRDLEIILDYAFDNYQEVNIIGCSIGAFFTLHAIKNRNVKRCLFLSPVVDMEYLISKMFLWFNVTEELLKEEKEIQTPVDPLRYDYYCFVKEHPIESWNISTSILYGLKDNLQSYDVMKAFCEKFKCDLQVSNDSEHAFMKEKDYLIFEEWIYKKLS